MAEQNLQTDFSRRLTQLSQCPVCNQPFAATDAARRPRLFQCTHTVCHRCADQLCRTQQTPACPVCRSQVFVTVQRRGDASGLPVNASIVDMWTLLADWRSMSCGRHPGKFADIYCLTCRVSVCAQCFFDAHRQHEVLLTAVVAERMRVELEAQLERLRQTVARLDEYRAAEALFDDAIQDLQRRVVEEQRRQRDRVDNDARRLTDELDRIRADRHRQNNFDQLSQSIRPVVDECRGVLDRHPFDLVRQADQVRQRAAAAVNQFPGLRTEDIRRVGVEFRPTPIDENIVGRLVVAGGGGTGSAERPTWQELNARVHESNETERRLRMELRQAEQARNDIQNRCALLAEELAAARQRVTDLIAANDQLQQVLDATEERARGLGEADAESKRLLTELRQRNDEIVKRARAEELERRRLEGVVNEESSRRLDFQDQLRQQTRLADQLAIQLNEMRVAGERRSDEMREHFVTVLRRTEQQARERMDRLERQANDRETALRQQYEEQLRQNGERIEGLNVELRQMRQRAERSERDVGRLRGRLQSQNEAARCPSSRTCLFICAILVITVVGLFGAVMWNLFVANSCPKLIDFGDNSSRLGSTSTRDPEVASDAPPCFEQESVGGIYASEGPSRNLGCHYFD